MSALSMELLQRVREGLLEDTIALENIRWHRANVALVCDGESWTLRIREGQIDLDAGGPQEDAPIILLRGSSQDWQRITDGLRGGLHRAFRHKIISFEGDAVATLTLWKTLWRLGEHLGEAGLRGGANAIHTS